MFYFNYPNKKGNWNEMFSVVFSSANQQLIIFNRTGIAVPFQLHKRGMSRSVLQVGWAQRAEGERGEKPSTCIERVGPCHQIQGSPFQLPPGLYLPIKMSDFEFLRKYLQLATASSSLFSYIFLSHLHKVVNQKNENSVSSCSFWVPCSNGLFYLGFWCLFSLSFKTLMSSIDMPVSFKYFLLLIQ